MSQSPSPAIDDPSPWVPGRRTRAALWSLLALAVALFLFRGVWRGHQNSIDFKMIYASTVVWTQGGEAYSSEAILATFRQRGGDPEHENRPDWFYSLYPPSTYLLLSPLALLRWPAAQWVWLLINVAAVAVIIALGARCMGWTDRRRLLAWAVLALLFAPVHTVISQGQVSLVCAALIFGAILALVRGASTSAGILLGLAAAAKPQVGLPLILILPILGRWRGFLAACITGLLVLGAAILRLELSHVNWLGDLAESLHRFSPSGEFGAGRGNTSSWYILLSLETLLLRINDSVPLAAGISYAFTGAVLGCLAIAFRRAPDRSRPIVLLHLAAALAALTLIPTYHRFYDAVLLLPAVMLVIDELWFRQKAHAPAILAAIGLAVFFLPNSVVLAARVGQRLGIESSLPYGITVMTHQIWAVLAVVVGLTWWMVRRGRAGGISTHIQIDRPDRAAINNLAAF